MKYWYKLLWFNNLGWITAALTVPKNLSSEIKYPAIVLLSDSEPDDRDNTFGAHKLFKVLADYLTNQGFAVLRTDDRGVGDTKVILKTLHLMILMEDAAAAVRFLKTRPEVDTTKSAYWDIVKGLVAPALAAGDKTIRFWFWWQRLPSVIKK